MLMLLVLLVLIVTCTRHPGVGLGSSLHTASNNYHYHDYGDYDADVIDDCVMIPLSTTHSDTPVYVTAFYESRDDAAAVACSNGSMTSSSRVHVISVTGVGPLGDDVRRRLPRIRVNIVSAASSSSAAGNVSSGASELEGGSVVVVLAAPVSVTWQLRVHQPLSHSTLFQFWALNGSRVVQGSRRVAGVHHFSLATVDTDAVVTWTRRHIGPLTSLNEPEMSPTITLRVGQPDCPAPAVLSPRQVQGCVLPSDNAVRRRDVHVIEVTGSPEVTSRGAAARVIVRAESRRRRHVVLLLRYHGRVTSYVRTERLRGSLDIVAEHAVNTDAAQLRQVRVVAERLSLVGGGADLLAWTADKYGRPTSYSRVDQFADVIVINVDATNVQTRTTPDSVARLRSAPTTDVVSQPRTYADLVRSRLRSSVMRSRSLNCRTDSIVVSVSKQLIQGFGITESQLSLRDGACHPLENSTHYVWTVNLEECGTEMHRRHSVVRYDNSIVISGLESLAANAAAAADWVYNADDEFSGGSTDETDVEDASSVSVAFHCYHSLPSAEWSDDIQLEADSDVNYELTLYKDANYQHQLTSFPAAINDKQRLYVQASVTAEESSDKGVMIRNCSIVAADSTQRLHPLIVNGCVSDKAVRWREQPAGVMSGGGQRFEMVLARYWSNVTRMSLQCVLTVCSKTSSTSSDQLPPCWTASQLCLQSNLQDMSVPRRLTTESVLVSRGPLYLNNDLTMDASSRSEALQQCTAAVRVVGLEITAVVGIAFAAFAIGILLTGTLWLIYTRTAVPPAKKRCAHNTSGESTLSSSTPLAPQAHRVV